MLQTQAAERQMPPERGRRILPQNLQSLCGPAHSLTTEFSPPELWESKHLSHQAAKLEAIHHGCLENVMYTNVPLFLPLSAKYAIVCVCVMHMHTH